MFLDFWPILMFFNFVLRILWEMIQFDEFFSTGWFDRASSKYNLKTSPRNEKKKVIFQVLHVLGVPAVSFDLGCLVIDDGSITNYVHFWDSIWMEIYLYLHESFKKKTSEQIIPSLKKRWIRVYSVPLLELLLAISFFFLSGVSSSVTPRMFARSWLGNECHISQLLPRSNYIPKMRFINLISIYVYIQIHLYMHVIFIQVYI